MEELLQEAKNGAERAKLMGPAGWSVCALVCLDFCRGLC